jgi:steroid delta-isomerase-like uncharacterized protein
LLRAASPAAAESQRALRTLGDTSSSVEAHDGEDHMTAFEDLTQNWTDAFNRHDPRAVAAIYTQDCVAYDPILPEPLKGRAAVEKDAADFFRAFPDVRVEVINIFEKGDRAAGEFKFTGTNNGPLVTPMGEVPATGKHFDMRGAFVGRINAENLIVEERRYYDTGTLMQQLGLVPQAAEAVAAR